MSLQLANQIEALNVTTQKVNLGKRDAVTDFMKRLKSDRLRTKGLEELFKPDYRDDGTASRIGQALVVTYDDHLAKGIQDKIRNEALAQSIQDELTDLIGKMNI